MTNTTFDKPPKKFVKGVAVEIFVFRVIYHWPAGKKPPKGQRWPLVENYTPDTDPSWIAWRHGPGHLFLQWRDANRRIVRAKHVNCHGRTMRKKCLRKRNVPPPVRPS